MSDRTSDVDSTQSPASDAQPVWNEDRAAWWLANADARERQLQPVSDALDIAAPMINAARQRVALPRSSGSSATQRRTTSRRRPMTP